MSNVGLIVAEDLASLSFMIHLSSLFHVFCMIGENKLIKIMNIPENSKYISSKKISFGPNGQFWLNYCPTSSKLISSNKNHFSEISQKILFWAEWEALCQLLSKIMQAYIPGSASTISTKHQTFRMSQYYGSLYWRIYCNNFLKTLLHDMGQYVEQYY